MVIACTELRRRVGETDSNRRPAVISKPRRDRDEPQSNLPRKPWPESKGEINAALNSSEANERIRKPGMEALGSTPQEFDRHLHAEADKWARVVRGARIKRD